MRKLILTKPVHGLIKEAYGRPSAVFIVPQFPFICRVAPLIKPIIGKKHPSVESCGFTLVELVVVLIIVSILTLIAAPAMNSLIESNKLTTLTNDLIADINLSRSTAIARNAQVGMCSSAGSGTSCGASTNWGASGWLLFVDADASGTWSNGDTIIRTHEAAPTNSALTSPLNLVFITRLGTMATGSAGSFIICNSSIGKSRTIVIATTGRPNITAGSC